MDSKRIRDGRDHDDDERRREKKTKRARSRSPLEKRERKPQRKRRHSRSKSPDASVKHENQNDPSRQSEMKSEPPMRRAKETDMLNTRTGGAYIPPARLRMMQAQITDKSSVAYQRLAWEALKKSIHGHINKINVGNIGIIIKELLKENIVRGRGLLCRSVIQAQAASPTFTNVYAALVAAVNSRFPNIGELLLKRLVIQFKRGFKRNDKPICISSASFIAHLVNQRVAHEILALELLTLLVETPTDDSVEVAIAFLKECGQKLTEVSSKGVNAIFEMLRNILHEGQLDKRVQYMIEVMFQVWKDGFKDHPALIEELELVPEEEQFTHLLMLDDATDPQDILNVFKFDDKYEDNEQKYKTLSKEILGSDAESDEGDGSGESGSDGSDDDDDDQEDGEQKGVTIIDNTETNLVALRRTIYLTINSSLDFEECAHKLMKMQLKPGQEVELCHMFLDCCAEQRTYEKFYGLLAQRFCNINRIYIGPFEDIFKDSYSTAHRLDTNRLRNVSKFFAHLLFTDSISWEVLECVKLNEEDTTSSSRIYIKILFQELAEYMGLKKLNDRLKDPTLQSAFSGVFPRDNPKNTRFSINFFTSIGLGGLTDELREHLKQMPKNVPPPAEINVGSESSSDSSSSSSSSSDSSSNSSSSDSEEEESSKKKKKDKKKSKTNDTPNTPGVDEADKNKNVERWGHDGFYDTYGKDAQRHQPRNERDKDNFAIPRDVPRRREQKDGEERRKNPEDPRNRRRDDDERRERDRRERNYDNGRDNEAQNDSRRNRDFDRQDRNVRDERRDRDGENYRRDRHDSAMDSGYESRNKRTNDDDRRDTGKSRRDDKRERDRNDSERITGLESKNKKSNDDDKRDTEKSHNRKERDRNDSERNSGYESKNKKSNDDDKRDTEKSNDRKEKDRNDYRKDRVTEEHVGEYEKSRIRRHEDDNDKRDRERNDRDVNRDEQNERSKSKRDSEKEDVDTNVEKKKKEKRSRKDKEKETESDESSDDDNSSSRKRDKGKRKSDDEDSRSKRKTKKKSKKRNKENHDGWDIRGCSIRREDPVPSRFWDSYEGGKRETVERSPDRTPERRSNDKKRDK